MAEERSFRQGEKRGQHPDLNERLTSYYGAALPEQPLSASSWQQVRSQLGLLPRTRFRSRFRGRHVLPGGSVLRRAHPSIPPYIAEAFLRLSWDARTPFVLSTLDCRFRARVPVSTVHVSPSGSGKIRLTLPASAMLAIEPQMLDVLLATGMARLLYTRRVSYILGNLLLLGLAVLAAVVCLVLWRQDRLSLLELLIAIGLWTAIGALQHVRGRRLALRADDLMVQWLGRTRACQGLHMLADRSRGARLAWKEPSLAERIARVCGTGVETEDERLTLVR